MSRGRGSPAAMSLQDFLCSTEPPPCSINLILKLQKFLREKEDIKKINYKVNLNRFAKTKIKIFEKLFNYVQINLAKVVL